MSKKYLLPPNMYINLLKGQLKQSKESNINLRAENRYIRQRLTRIKAEIERITEPHYNSKR